MKTAKKPPQVSNSRDAAEIKPGSINGGLDIRVSKLESVYRRIQFVCVALGVLGISGGTILWYGYSSLKDKEREIRNDYNKLWLDSQKAADRITDIWEKISDAEKDFCALKKDNAKVLSDALDKYSALSDAYIELKGKVTKANDVASTALSRAGELIISVEKAASAAAKSENASQTNVVILKQTQKVATEVKASFAAMQDSQRALEAYLSGKIADKEREFTVEISGSSTHCSFVSGESIPYSRKIGGSFSRSVVVVPKNSICRVKVSASFCDISIQRELQGRVIVEGSGSSCSVRYMK